MNKSQKLFIEARESMGLKDIYDTLIEKIITRNKTYTGHVYLFGQTLDNEDSILNAVATYPNKNATFLIPKYSSHGFAGFDRWNSIIKDKMKRNTVEVPQLKLDRVNTYTEAQSLVEYLHNEKLGEINIIGAEFHQLRAFWSLASAILKRNLKIRVYNYKGSKLSWDEEVVHSQGTLSGKRRDFIRSELDRIIKYQKNGDLCSAEEIYDYIKWLNF